MKWFEKLNKFGSIKSDIIAGALILVLIISAIPSFILVHIYGQALTESRVNLAASLARGTAGLLAQQDDWKRFNWEYLAVTAGHSGLHLVLVTDADGRQLYRGQMVAPRDETALRVALAEGREERTTGRRFGGGHSDERFAVAAPIMRNNLVAGAICFSGGLGTADAIEDKIAVWLVVFIAVNALLVSLFVIFFLNRNLVGPLRELARDLKALGGNEFVQRPRRNTSKEMAELFASFDQAAMELMDSRRRLEEQLTTIVRTQKQLAASEKMAAVGRLASGLAHELGNPIGALMGFVRLLGDPGLEAETRDMMLKQSACELARMDGSIKELLKFSRPSRPEPERVDAVAAALSALTLTRPQKWAVNVHFDLESEEPRLEVMAERNLLLQVFLNLLANACQAFAPDSPARRQVRIDLKRTESGDEVRISVADNGPGVAPEDVPHIFEPYFTRKEPGLGTGLGLAISMSTLNDFGGRIEYAPAEGGGAVFVFYLPAAV